MAHIAPKTKVVINTAFFCSTQRSNLAHAGNRDKIAQGQQLELVRSSDVEEENYQQISITAIKQRMAQLQREREQLELEKTRERRRDLTTSLDMSQSEKYRSIRGRLEELSILTPRVSATSTQEQGGNKPALSDEAINQKESLIDDQLEMLLRELEEKEQSAQLERRESIDQQQVGMFEQVFQHMEQKMKESEEEEDDDDTSSQGSVEETTEIVADFGSSSVESALRSVAEEKPEDIVPKWSVRLGDVMSAKRAYSIFAARFVSLRDSQSKLRKNKRRIFSVDLRKKTVVEIDYKTGKILNDYASSAILSATKMPKPTVLRLIVAYMTRPIDIIFQSSIHREFFYHNFCIIRPQLNLWCPDLVKPAYSDSVTKVEGVADLVGPNYPITPTLHVTNNPFEDVTVFCGTWSLGFTFPDDFGDVLQSWIPVGEYDIYAITIQECKNISNILPEILGHMGSKYVTLAYVELADMLACVLVNSKHVSKVSNVQGNAKPARTFNTNQNKGAIAISVRFNQSDICFVSCYFDGTHEAVQQRNQNIAEVCNNMGLGYPNVDLVNQFQQVFWMGRLNYKIDLPCEAITQKVAQGDYGTIIKNDQLSREIAQKKILSGFIEPKIDFPPTAKYALGKDEFCGENPSYPDRVLCKSFPNLKLEPLHYASVSQVTSEYKPVQAMFKMATKRCFISAMSKMPDKPTSWTLRFKEIAMQDTEVNLTLKNPILAFYSMYTETPFVKSKALSKPKKIKWEEKQLPAIAVHIPNEGYLKHEYIVIVLRDGKGNSGKYGQAILSLREVDQTAKTFVVPLTLNTMSIGSLAVTVKLDVVVKN